MKKRAIMILGAVLGPALLTACGNAGQADNTDEVLLETTMEVSDSGDENQQEQELERPKETASEETELTGTGGEAMASDEEQILAVYKRMQQAMVDKDTDTLREMRGEDTIIRHITGRTQTMDEWLSDVENEEMKYYSIEVVDPEIVIDGDTAALTCSNVIDARIYGSRGTWTLSGRAAFEKIEGEWVMSHPKNE